MGAKKRIIFMSAEKHIITLRKFNCDSKNLNTILKIQLCRLWCFDISLN